MLGEYSPSDERSAFPCSIPETQSTSWFKYSLFTFYIPFYYLYKLATNMTVKKKFFCFIRLTYFVYNILHTISDYFPWCSLN
jgi:hypothetical protein